MFVPIATLSWLLATGPLAAQSPSIVNTPHNLSASGPGRIRAAGEQQVCIFCHTPHRASPIQPLWNRQLPVSAYTVYTSNSLKALPGQPTGSSKLCLSCHDGTIALGSVLSRNQTIAMAGGITTLPPGSGNLGTDLSDDHPISFRYDSLLIEKNLKLANPAGLPPQVKLDANKEMQCTSCHDAHNNRYGKFLVLSNQNSELCKLCHQLGTTGVVEHQACNACHQPHTAPSGPYLLTNPKVAETCTACHSAAGGAINIASQLNKVSVHETRSAPNPPIPRPAHQVTCVDCHESHTIASAGASAPNASPRFGAIHGVNSGGAAVAQARYEYEVCFKCHAELGSVQPVVTRQVVQTNTRLEFDSSAVSFHPVQVRGRNNDVPSLKPGLTANSLIYCTDCHNSDSSRLFGGAGPNGPHGSMYRPMLVHRYELADNSTESAANYALCYRCHLRNSILNDESFAKHRRHVVEEHTPCSVCHDPHGISSGQGTAARNSHLINFNVNVVKPAAGSNRLEYEMLGVRHGRCFLFCHGKNHNPKTY